MLFSGEYLPTTMSHTLTVGWSAMSVWSRFPEEIVANCTARLEPGDDLCGVDPGDGRIPSRPMTRATGDFVSEPKDNGVVNFSLRAAGKTVLTSSFVSSKHQPPPSGGTTSWNSLTSTRQRLLKATTFLMGSDEFTRRELQDAVASTDLSSVVDDQDSINVRTGMLNNLVEDDHYLVKTHQSDKVPFVLYVGGNGPDEETFTGLRESELRRLVEKVLRLEGQADSDVSHIDFSDLGDVVVKVNGLVERPVLTIVSDPNEYRMSSSGLKTVKSRL